MQQQDKQIDSTIGQVLTMFQVQPDWWTLTSYDERMLPLALSIAKAVYPNGKRHEGAKVMQYLGWNVSGGMGTLFYGEALQDGRQHYMIRISGEAAANSQAVNDILPAVRSGWVRVTRMDVQLTRDMPKGWQQGDLFTHAKEAGKTVGWYESRTVDGKQLATVYIGSRSSARFVRVYQKLVGDVITLRIEYELKAEVAQAFANMLAYGRATWNETLSALVQHTGIPMVETAVSSILAGISPKHPKIIRQEPRTTKWIRQTVLPSLTRYAASHDADEELLQEIVTAIKRARLWRDAYDD